MCLGPGHPTCPAGHRLHSAGVWKLSQAPERPVWAYTGPAPAYAQPLACTGRCSLPDCVA